MWGRLLGNPHVAGNIIFGETEANLIAICLAEQGKPSVSYPPIVDLDSILCNHLGNVQLV